MFRIIAPFTFWDTWNVCLKVAYFLRKIQTLRVNSSRILWIKNAKFSGYCFYMNTKLKLPNPRWCTFGFCPSNKHNKFWTDLTLLSNIKLYNQPVLICGQPVHTLACMCCCWKLQGFQRLLSTSRVDSDENNFSPVKFYLKFLSKFVFDAWILTVLSFSNLTDFSCIYWAKFKPFWTNIPLM